MRRFVVSSALASVACTVATPGYGLDGETGASTIGGTSDGTSSTATGTTTGTTTTGTTGTTSTTGTTGTTGTGDGDGDGDGDSGGDGTGADGGASIFECDVQPPALRACYLFDDAMMGDTPDGSMYGHTMTLFGDGMLAPGAAGAGQSLGSSTVGGADTPGTAELNQTIDFTVEFWMNPDDWQGPVHYLAERAGQWAILQEQGVFICDMGPASAQAETMALPAPGVWTHVACVLDGTAARLYYDGVEVVSEPRMPGGPGTPGSSMSIGTRPSPETGFRGRIDEFRLWSVARTPALICESAGC